MTNTISRDLTLTGSELALLGEALEALALRNRWEEVAVFAAKHPEFGLLCDDEEPVAEELL